MNASIAPSVNGVEKTTRRVSIGYTYLVTIIHTIVTIPLYMLLLCNEAHFFTLCYTIEVYRTIYLYGYT